jgi:hypothetical protein
MEHRRGERLPAGRSGLCRVKSDPGVEWRNCRLIALSMLGLTIDVQQPSPTAILGRRGIVEVTPFDDSVIFRLEGSICEALPMRAEQTIRVGIAFGRLSATERYMIDVLTWTQVDLKTASR